MCRVPLLWIALRLQGPIVTYLGLIICAAPLSGKRSMTFVVNRACRLLTTCTTPPVGPDRYADGDGDSNNNTREAS